MGRETYGWMGEELVEWVERRMDGWENCGCVERQADEWSDGQMGGRWMSGWRDRWMDGETSGWVEIQTDGWSDGRRE